MSNSDCDAVYGNVNDGHICIDSTGGKGTCSVCIVQLGLHRFIIFMLNLF